MFALNRLVLFARRLAAVSVLLTVGCGPDLGTVNGHVTLDGKPIKGVEITFEPVGQSGGTAMGYTNAEGNYALQFPGRQAGAPPGEYMVRLAGSEVDDVGQRVKIPPKFNSQSDLKRTVSSGDNKFDFDLTSK